MRIGSFRNRMSRLNDYCLVCLKRKAVDQWVISHFITDVHHSYPLSAWRRRSGYGSNKSEVSLWFKWIMAHCKNISAFLSPCRILIPNIWRNSAPTWCFLGTACVSEIVYLSTQRSQNGSCVSCVRGQVWTKRDLFAGYYHLFVTRCKLSNGQSTGNELFISAFIQIKRCTLWLSCLHFKCDHLSLVRLFIHVALHWEVLLA